MMRACLFLFTAMALPGREAAGGVKGWPAEVEKVSIPGDAGGQEQPALFWKAPGAGKAPLLVGLHTWSSDYRQAGSSLPYLQWCRQEGWHFIHPNFGGPNYTPGAMGSDAAVAGVARAVAWARQQADVDAERIYLIGVSGGGHMALLMAGRHPELWAGVSAWCGISDIAQWHADCRAAARFGRYADDIEKALGGAPDADPEKAADARQRSPVSWLAGARGLPLDIQAGVHDGRSGSVPFAHSLRAFNAVAGAAAAMPETEIAAFYASRQPPVAATPDALHGQWQPVFRRAHENTRVTIFEGGHEIVHVVALNWLAQQRQGRPAVWEIAQPKPLELDADAAQSGK